MRQLGLFVDRSTSVRDAAWFKMFQILLVFKEMIKYISCGVCEKKAGLKMLKACTIFGHCFLCMRAFFCHSRWLTISQKICKLYANCHFQGQVTIATPSSQRETPYTSKRLLMVEKNKPLTVKSQLVSIHRQKIRQFQ